MELTLVASGKGGYYSGKGAMGKGGMPSSGPKGAAKGGPPKGGPKGGPKRRS